MDLITDDLDQNDSGMESLTTSKGDTPERRPMDSSSPPTTDLEVFGFPSMDGTSGPLKEYDDEPDESLSERLWGLSEMCGMKSLYGFSRSVMWVIASSSVILFAPVIFEVERAQMAEMEKSQQKQVLLGTNTALAGPMPSMPPMPR
ncbi:Maggie [Operophtera brumata]|uniref:Mitochondrial import receptor subunit TOM22 homolog n=1 Tax=Operophtera brumata TaxID=104452 RepID=A0A0L7LV22_OPEBR|nr:Maggie [Operophtera brumata]